MKALRVWSDDNHMTYLQAVCTDEAHAMEVFRAWVAGLDVKRRPANFRVEIGPV